MFQRLRAQAKSTQAIHPESIKVIEFCDEVIEIYKKYGFQSND
jgi:hypothetical protein